jgi:hypothetical protein
MSAYELLPTANAISAMGKISLPARIRAKVPCRPSACQIAAGVRDGDFTAVEVVAWTRHCIALSDPEIQAFECLDPTADSQAHKAGASRFKKCVLTPTARLFCDLVDLDVSMGCCRFRTGS